MPNRLIVMRLAEMHRVHPLQIERKCHGCGEVVGIYPSGQVAILREPDIEILCNHCHPIGNDPVRLAPGAEVEPFQSVRAKR
jgi:hypothetical protein